MSPDQKSKRQQRREKIYQQERRSRLITIGLITIGVAVLVFLFVAPQLKSAGNVIPITPHELPSPNGLSLGDPKAPVTIDVYEDFQCPACRYFDENVEPQDRKSTRLNSSH